MTTIDITNLSEEALDEVLIMARMGASAEAINRLLAVTANAETLYAARANCLCEENSETLLRAAKALRISIAVA